MINPSIKIELSTMPSQPGVYQFLNKENKIIYIGKAKNLKKELLLILDLAFPLEKQKTLLKTFLKLSMLLLIQSQMLFFLRIV